MTKNSSELDVLGYLRYALIVALAVTGYLLLLRWQADYVTVDQNTNLSPVGNETSLSSNNLPPITKNDDVLDSAYSDAGADAIPEVVSPSSQLAGDIPTTLPAITTGSSHAGLTNSKSGSSVPKSIFVKTDTLLAEISLQGGDLMSMSLLQYPEKLDKENGFALLSNQSRYFVMQSGVLGTESKQDLDQQGRPQYVAQNTQFELGDREALKVPLIFEDEHLLVTKTYLFKKGSYQPEVIVEVQNKSEKNWSGVFFGQIVRDDTEDPSSGTGGFGLPTFNGAAFWTPEKRYNKLSFEEISEGVQTVHQGGWVAWVQHYFLAAWIFDPNQQLHVSARQIKGQSFQYNGQFKNRFAISFTQTNPTTIKPGQTGTFKSVLYTGPKVERELAAVADGLNLAVDYGFLFMISKLLFQLLSFIHGFVGNWGVAIILLTVFIKALFLWPSAISYRSMARMRQLQPELSRLKNEFGEDRQRMSQEMMKLYKKQKVNPFGGCLPVLLQMPVFFALYWTLLESVELRQAPFYAWIQDLSSMDPYFILPLLMGISMYIQTSLNPVPPDPTQAKVMKLMPIMFTVFFLFFPAGLVLYWLTNNVLSIAQQWYITKRIEA